MRRLLALILLACAVGVAPAIAADTPVPVVDSHGYLSLVGGMHGHSGYSDGYPGPTPKTVFASGKGFGLDFFGITDHSDNAAVPVTASEECLSPDGVKCVGGDADHPENSLRKWDATGEYAAEATTSAFSAIRGFEWTSDRFGHINVFFSRNYANAKTDGGYAATMETFYEWFQRRPELGGGGDGLATFNHPGDKDLKNVIADDAAFNWNDFAYVPGADDRMVGIELYNDVNEFGTKRRDDAPAEGYFAHALDKGWHVGAVGAEDLGHRPSDDWGGPSWAKTVILAERHDPASIRAAMLARRFYAVRTGGTRLDFTVDGNVMGSRLARAPGTPLALHAAVNNADAVLELVTTGGATIATGIGTLDVSLPATVTQGWYFVRARAAGEPIAYSSPVWVTPTARPPVGEWLAGDLHVHTCFSHDSYCPPGDDNTGPQPGEPPEDQADHAVNDGYTIGLNVDQRFTEAATKGLDYLAITDHNDVRSQAAPGFGGHGVIIGVPGYENSLHGHAQMLGATHVLSNGTSSAADVNAVANQLRAEGGSFQINHPTDQFRPPLDSTCSDLNDMGWKYGFDVRPDTIEVWNIGHFLQPPLPAGNSNDDAERYWECWLQRGAHVGATGGSDSHWLSTTAIQGPGNPTTWVFAKERSVAGVLQALREGRTAVSLLPPLLGSARLSLEADVDKDGVFESVIGDTVVPGAPMRVRAHGLLGQGFVRVRANGTTLVDSAQLAPGGEVTFTAPAQPGWVRASLLLPDTTEQRQAVCEPFFGSQTTYCRNHLVEVALTSPIYLAVPARPTAMTLTTITRGSTVRATAILTDDEGHPLAGRHIAFAVAQATGNAVTDLAGRAVAVLDVPDHGKFEVVTATYAGEPGFKPSTATATARWGR